jgi:hypothetical protein
MNTDMSRQPPPLFMDPGFRRDDSRRLAFAFALAALALAACAPAESSPDLAPLTQAELETYPDARGMPPDVQHFIVRWQDCTHWLGEPPYDTARARQIEEAVAATCPGLDARAEALRARYAAEPDILARLAGYDRIDQ